MDRDQHLRFQATMPELKPANSIEELLEREWSRARSAIEQGNLDEHLEDLDEVVATLTHIAAIPVPQLDPNVSHASIPDDASDKTVRYKLFFEGPGPIVEAALGKIRVGNTPIKTWSNGIGFDIESPALPAGTVREEAEAILREIASRWSEAVTRITAYNAGLSDRFRTALVERRDLLASRKGDT
jgi:hypothetical protein